MRSVDIHQMYVQSAALHKDAVAIRCEDWEWVVSAGMTMNLLQV